jgi:hypothetical protein
MQTDGRTDRHDEFNSRFSNFATAPKTNKNKDEFYVLHTVHEGKHYEQINRCTYELHTLFSNHTYMFWSSSATILSVYILKSTIKAVCVANQSTIHAVSARPSFHLQRITTFQTCVQGAWTVPGTRLEGGGGASGAPPRAAQSKGQKNVYFKFKKIIFLR